MGMEQFNAGRANTRSVRWQLVPEPRQHLLLKLADAAAPEMRLSMAAFLAAQRRPA
jgi:hypothetical protein